MTNYKDIICDANNLYEAYLASVKGSKWKESTQRFIINFMPYLFEIQDELINQTLTNSPTDEFIMHERGRIRPITSLKTKDRIVRHVFCDQLLLPEVKKKIIYDNGASIKDRGISFARNRFETHLRKYYLEYGTNEGYILFGDFSKFYDNILHVIAKKQLLELFDDDSFVDWLLTLIFDGFKIDVSYMSDNEYQKCLEIPFNKLNYREIPRSQKTKTKFMEKSVNIGDQLSQVIGIYYPNRIDTYVKYVRSQKYYARYMDDWYIINRSRDILIDILENITKIADSLGIIINHSKTRLIKLSKTFKYLQIKYALTSNGKIIKRINPKRLSIMRRKLKKLAIKVYSEIIEYDQVEQMFRGWMTAHYKLMSKKQRTNLFKLYEDLFNKHITIYKKKMIFSEVI